MRGLVFDVAVISVAAIAAVVVATAGQLIGSSLAPTGPATYRG